MNRGSILGEIRGTPRSIRTTMIVFALLVLLGASNPVAVRFSNLEFPPFWGAAVRFSMAALVFWVVVLVGRITLPGGRVIFGIILYGVLAIGIVYLFLYWGLLEVQAGLTMVILAFVPLATHFFAIAHGIEKWRWRTFIGSLIAIAGIIMAIGEGVGAQVPLLSILALVAAALFMAEGSVVYKLLPKHNPAVTNAVSMSAGAVFLILVSAIVGEDWNMPTSPNATISLLYLILIGSVGVFYLYLFVLSRWPASVTNYSFLLTPMVTVILAAWLLGEEVTLSLIIGGTVVLVGVWVGALSGAGRISASENSTSSRDVSY